MRFILGLTLAIFLSINIGCSDSNKPQGDGAKSTVAEEVEEIPTDIDGETSDTRINPNLAAFSAKWFAGNVKELFDDDSCFNFEFELSAEENLVRISPRIYRCSFIATSPGWNDLEVDYEGKIYQEGAVVGSVTETEFSVKIPSASGTCDYSFSISLPDSGDFSMSDSSTCSFGNGRVYFSDLTLNYKLPL